MSEKKALAELRKIIFLIALALLITAVGVCESMLGNARKYIANQEEHHKTKSFDDEFDDFLKRAGFEKFDDKKIRLKP